MRRCTRGRKASLQTMGFCKGSELLKWDREPWAQKLLSLAPVRPSHSHPVLCVPTRVNVETERMVRPFKPARPHPSGDQDSCTWQGTRAKAHLRCGDSAQARGAERAFPPLSSPHRGYSALTLQVGPLQVDLQAMHNTLESENGLLA